MSDKSQETLEDIKMYAGIVLGIMGGLQFKQKTVNPESLLSTRIQNG